MASYAEQLMLRLAAIEAQRSDQTTWEQLAAKRKLQQEQAQQAIKMIDADTEAYRTQLRNYANIYNSGQVVRPPASSKPVTTKPTKKKSTPKKKKSDSSLGGSLFGGLGDSLGSLF